MCEAFRQSEENMVNYKENRGSEWRKWDLHIHTPESGLANGFGSDWDEYVKTLFTTAIQNEVAVLGITDYFTIDGYTKLVRDYLQNDDKLRQLFDDDTIIKIKKILVLPNVEFRLKQTVNGNRINYHVIFSNELSIDEINENFFGSIDLVKDRFPDGSENTVKLNHKNIESFGKKIKAEQPEFTGSDFEVGCKTAIIDEENILKSLSKKVFKDKFITVIPPDEDLSDIAWTKQDHQVRKLFVQGCNAFFASNKGTIAFALGEKHSSKKEYLKEFKSFKPCFIGCDAHSLDAIKNKLGVYSDEKQSKTTWIKADTTFQGLLQTIYEPELRVRIQAGKPEVKNARNVISSLVLTDAEGKFSGNSILLNDGLNSIIGGKSSGKTLLLHSLALAIDRAQVERISGKLNIQGYQKLNFDLEVKWADGRIDKLSKATGSEDEERRKVTYIPQLYINYLAERNNRDELNQLILNILLQNADFAKFYEEKTAAIKQLTHTINTGVDQMLQYREEGMKYFNQLNENGREKDITKSIQLIEAQIKELEKNLTLTDQEKQAYDAFKKKEEELNKKITSFSKYIEIEKEIEEYAFYVIENMVGKKNETGHLKGGEIESKLSYYPDIPEPLKNHFLSFRTLLNQAKESLPKSFETLGYAKALQEVNKQLQSERKTIENVQKKINGQKELKEANDKLKKEKERLTKAIELNNKVMAAVEQYRTSQTEIANALRYRSKLYKEVVDKVNQNYNEMPNGITLSAYLKSKIEECDFYNYVNKNSIAKTHPFNSIYTGEEKVDYHKLADLFADVKNVRDNKIALSSSDDINYPLRQDVKLADVFKSLAADIVEYGFEVKYKNDSLFDMSPGKKGTVLLILFLQLNSSEYPILIDQPEDNLDNRTIYELLCKMIRTKKKDRQIILISHNANIVVATDSENIIVANQTGQNESEHTNKYRFEYVNGSIETSFDMSSDKSLSDLDSKGIRQHVCDILEGGDDAFLEREQKYSIRRYE